MKLYAVLENFKLGDGWSWGTVLLGVYGSEKKAVKFKGLMDEAWKLECQDNEDALSERFYEIKVYELNQEREGL